MIDDRWIICPFCGWGKKYETKKQVNVLDKIDSVTGPFIDHRDISGGRGSGFSRKYTENLKEIYKMPQYKSLIQGLRKQCLQILEIIGDK